MKRQRRSFKGQALAPAAFGISLLLVIFSCAVAVELMTPEDFARYQPPPPQHTIAYGDDPLQFGHLRLPTGEGPFPVMIFIHGGCWLGAVDIGHAGPLEQAIADAGYAVWSIEYRRVGNAGGGWPNTLLDVARAVDHLRHIGPAHSLDLERVVVSGHSAGGALALWVGARHKILPSSDLYVENPLEVSAVIALAPAADLEGIQMSLSCGNVIGRLMGGTLTAQPDRYRDASPMQLAPIGVPQVLLIGQHDASWAATGLAYYYRALGVGDQQVQLVVLPESGHLEMIAPDTSTWSLVMAVVNDVFEAGGAESAEP